MSVGNTGDKKIYLSLLKSDSKTVIMILDLKSTHTLILRTDLLISR